MTFYISEFLDVVGIYIFYIKIIKIVYLYTDLRPDGITLNLGVWEVGGL